MDLPAAIPVLRTRRSGRRFMVVAQVTLRQRSQLARDRDTPERAFYTAMPSLCTVTRRSVSRAIFSANFLAASLSDSSSMMMLPRPSNATGFTTCIVTGGGFKFDEPVNPSSALARGCALPKESDDWILRCCRIALIPNWPGATKSLGRRAISRVILYVGRPKVSSRTRSRSEILR